MQMILCPSLHLGYGADKSKNLKRWANGDRVLRLLPVASFSLTPGYLPPGARVT